MLTLAFTFLIIAILFGVFGFIAAGPAGTILFFVFLVLAVWSFVRHRRDGSRPQDR